MRDAASRATVKKVVPPKVGTDGKLVVPVDYYALSQQIAQGLQQISQTGANAIQQVCIFWPLPAAACTCSVVRLCTENSRQLQSSAGACT